MAKNRVIYNIEGLFVGPAPASGFHFMDTTGLLKNTPIRDGQTVNLVKHIPRVQSVNYGIAVTPRNTLALGKRSSLARTNIDPMQIDLSFEYLQAGIIGELRLGFYVNYPLLQNPYSGETYYSDNFKQSAIDGFVTRSSEREKNNARWPYYYRDKRNIFIAVNNDTQSDLNMYRPYYQEIDDRAKNWSVYAFGGCYLTSYNASASIGNFARASVNYVADNLLFHTSGSGVHIPAVNLQTLIPFSGVKFALPTPYEGTIMPAALLPGDITVSIQSIQRPLIVPAVQTGTPPYATFINSNVENWGVDYNDIKIQSYTLNLDLNRVDLNTMGYRLPTDKVIDFPIFVNTNINALVGDITTGDVSNLFKENYDYNITIKIRNPYNKGDINGVAVQYNLLRSKLTAINYDSSIGSNKSIGLTFQTELDPDDLSRGLFISGLLNTDTAGLSSSFDNWVTESAENVVTENNQDIIVSSWIFFY